MRRCKTNDITCLYCRQIRWQKCWAPLLWFPCGSHLIFPPYIFYKQRIIWNFYTLLVLFMYDVCYFWHITVESGFWSYWLNIVYKVLQFYYGRHLYIYMNTVIRLLLLGGARKRNDHSYSLLLAHPGQYSTSIILTQFNTGADYYGPPFIVPCVSQHQHACRFKVVARSAWLIPVPL